MIQITVNPIRLVATVMIVCIVSPFSTQAQQRVANATAGISVVPPAGWHVASMQDVLRNRSEARLSDRKLEAGLQRAAPPLFAFSKYQEPSATLNPTVQIVLRPLPSSLGSSPTAMLRAATATLQRAFSDFAFVEPIQDAEISGVRSAYMKATYTLRTAERGEHRVMSRTWLVPHGSFMYLIGMSGPTEGPDVSEAEFATALKSIAIER
jgi:hypothetical protein